MKRIKKALIFLLVLLLLFVSCKQPIEDSVNLPLSSSSNFTIYYIDVNQGDCSLVVCDGYTMLIDGGSVAESSKIYSFLKNNNISHLDYIVATHAHEDHVGGLSGALNYASVDVAFSPVTEYQSNAFSDFIKYLSKQNVSITVPTYKDTFSLGSATVTILGPIMPAEETNNTSIVLRITYGNTSFLFTGDSQRQEEQDILEEGLALSSSVLKVAHHGSDTSTSYLFLNEIMPKYAVISCGKDNMYGHPHESVLSRLRDAEVEIYRTDLQGTIICKSDGDAISFTTERNSNIQTNPTETDSDELLYIGNVRTGRFHRPDCSGLPLEKNRIYFLSRQDALAKGYSPCLKCNP